MDDDGDMVCTNINLTLVDRVHVDCGVGPYFTPVLSLGSCARGSDDESRDLAYANFPTTSFLEQSNEYGRFYFGIKHFAIAFDESSYIVLHN